MAQTTKQYENHSSLKIRSIFEQLTNSINYSTHLYELNINIIHSNSYSIIKLRFSPLM